MKPTLSRRQARGEPSRVSFQRLTLVHSKFKSLRPKGLSYSSRLSG